MKIKAVFFDLDGTLLYTIEDIASSLNRVLERHAFPIHSIETYCTFIGDGMKLLVTRALPAEIQADQNKTDFIVAEFRKEYSIVENPTTCVYDGIPELLLELKKRGVTCAVVTNKPHDKALDVVARFFPNTFDVVVGQRDGIPVKPDPASAKEVQQKLGLTNDEIIYIGDSGVDMTLAATAGYFAVGCSWGYRSVEELKAKGAQVIIETPLEALGFC